MSPGTANRSGARRSAGHTAASPGDRRTRAPAAASIRSVWSRLGCGSTAAVGVLRNVSALFEPNENLHFTFERNNLKELPVYADKEQLSRAFLNLIKNGIQSIPAEQIGKISISVQNNSSTALVSISDNGTGISPEAQEHLFEPNFTTKTSGMGLGLSIVQNIIQSFGGKISYVTSNTSGTTFFVEIPIHSSTKPNENKRS
jgi:signal transduction histidine kinase